MIYEIICNEEYYYLVCDSVSEALRRFDNWYLSKYMEEPPQRHLSEFAEPLGQYIYKEIEGE